MKLLKLKRALLLSLASLLLFATSAFADGFSVLEWSAGGVAMGEAYMFAEEDPSLLAYNPAGITRLSGSYLSGGLSYINPRGRADFYGSPLPGANETWSNAEAPAYVPHLYYTSQMNDRLWLGVGLFTRFGNSAQYDSEFTGRYNNYHAEIQTVTIQPTIAWKATPKLSVAAGADFMYMGIDIRKKIPTAILSGGLMPDANFQLDGSGTGWGWNVGFNYDFDDKTSLAAVYRSKVKVKVSGAVNLTAPGRSTRGHGEIELPESFTIGLGHKFNDRTRIELGATYTGWSSYDRLRILYDTALLPSPPFPMIMMTDDEKNWKNVWRYQIGLEHKINDKWSVLCGYAYDNNPMPDEYMDFMVPTGDRQTLSIGFKLRNKNSELTFAWGHMWIKDRVIYGSGYDFQYSDVRANTAHILSLSYRIKLR